MAKGKKKVSHPQNIALNASKQKQFNQHIHKLKQRKKVTGSAGVVYISHLPWGFEEKPLKKYFSQFGTIKQIRVSRSKKTGNSKGYAYIQFAHDEVAKIVAETMNNYLMFGKLIKCRHLTNPHPDTFRNAHRKFVKNSKFLQHAVTVHNSKKTDETIGKSQTKMLGKLAKIQAKLSEKGIKYSLEDEQLQTTANKLKEKKKEQKAERQDQKKKRKDEMKDEESEENDSEEEPSEGDDDYNDGEDGSSDEADDDDLIEKEAVEMSDDYVSGSDNDGGDDDGDDEILFATLPVKKAKDDSKSQSGKTPKSVGKKVAEAGKLTPKRQSQIPMEVDTPKGRMNVLVEDSSDEEITFRTPPMTIKSSKLDSKTPETTEKTSPKRKLQDKTPQHSAKKVKVTLREELHGKKSKDNLSWKSSGKVTVKSEFEDKSASQECSDLKEVSKTLESKVKTPGKKTPNQGHKQTRTPPSKSKLKGVRK